MFGAQTDVFWHLEGRDDLFSRHYDQVPAVFLLYLRLPLLHGVICHLAGRDEDQYLQVGIFFSSGVVDEERPMPTCNGDSIAGA